MPLIAGKCTILFYITNFLAERDNPPGPTPSAPSYKILGSALHITKSISELSKLHEHLKPHFVFIHKRDMLDLL